MSSDKNQQEEDYFRKQDQEKLRAMREEAARKKADEAEAELRKLHHFKCGKCGHDMSTQIFKGIEIEACSNCGAVLLDPGELEQLVGEDEGNRIKALADFFNFTRKK
ncbi:MAG: zf-TFIIB domain-containing protein [Myxococcota bacterium]|nr:zf-TFIIB domain-containing protein [Myxococcota bacterium]